MITALIGFLAPFIPDLIGMGKTWTDHRFEMQMMELRSKLAEKEHMWRVDEIEVQAAVADMREARKPHKSYASPLLDKAAESQGIVWKWAFNLVFLLFAFIDWLITSVRPGITYWAFGLYATVKMATLAVIYQASERFSDGAVDTLTKVMTNEAAFTQFDKDMLTLIISFWFGQRIRNGRASANAQP
ncbi:hypothetical protein [Thalassospira alkalitolerans]|uniref:hypothetical protein n=1 Tax=Thalassospira alkalitolerans TaxID=1293890 RepID=UPI003AA90E2D